MNKRIGKVVKINANMVTVELDDFVIQNEVAYILHGQQRLKAEVIALRCRYMKALQD